MPSEHDRAADPRGAARHRTRVRRVGVAVALCAAVLASCGLAAPPAPDGVSTDRLGPETGETVADYLDRARDSLTGTDDAEHWALLSFTDYVAAADLPALAEGVRVGRALYRVPLPRVVTPLVAVQIPDNATALTRSGTDAAWQLTARRGNTAPGARAARVLEVTIARLRAGCVCSPGLVVRAPLARLRAVAQRPGVRAVQALPADAVAERFAVDPLLPDGPDPIAPQPDDGAVPDR